MKDVQLIQIIFSGALFLATAVLALITYRYMTFTKRIADSTESQTKIMQKVFEQSVSPICRIFFHRSTRNDERGEFHYKISNHGERVFHLKEIRTNIWNENAPERIIQSHLKQFNTPIAPLPDQLNVNFSIEFNQEVRQKYPIIQKRKEIKKQSVFIIRDINNREYEFRDSVRSLY